MRNIGFLLAFILGTALSLHGQVFEWKSQLESVDSSGFYNIALKPEFTAKLNRNFSDVRLYNSQEQEVPYILRVDREMQQKNSYLQFKVIYNKHKKRKGYTRIVFQNPKKEDITNLSFIVKKTDIEKGIKLSGSDDQKKWYVLKEDFLFQSRYGDPETDELRLSELPKSNYKYYELLVSDFQNKEVQVEKVRYYKTFVKDAEYYRIESPKISQDDISKQEKSIVTLEFDETYYIDRLIFHLAGADYYMRKAKLSKNDTISEKKMKLEYYDQMEKSFYLSSLSENSVQLSSYKAGILTLEIDNKDNLPLKVTKVEAFQLKHYLTASLKAGENYTLRLGNSRLDPPMYDLKYFSDSIPDTIPVLEARPPLPIKEKPKATYRILHIAPVYLWIIIGVIAAFLIFMVVRMFREVNIQEQDF